jgi:myosin heavy subunit
MNQITITMNQILTLLSLYSEFIACLVAASVLSLFTGWMLSRSSAKKRMKAATRSWERSLRQLEDAATADTDNLEEQLQHLAGETRTLKATNRVLTDSLKKSDASIQKARAEAIELNRQNTETQERLQRVIQQKGREIVDSANRLVPETNKTPDLQGSTYTPPTIPKLISVALDVVINDDLDEEFETTLSETIDTGLNDPTPDSDDTAMNNADTIAFNPSDLFDSTLQMSAEDFIHQNRQLSLPTEAEFDDLIDDTADLSGMFIDDMEESTVALDDDFLAFAKRPFPVSNVD